MVNNLNYKTLLNVEQACDIQVQFFLYTPSMVLKTMFIIMYNYANYST